MKKIYIEVWMKIELLCFSEQDAQIRLDHYKKYPEEYRDARMVILEENKL